MGRSLKVPQDEELVPYRDDSLIVVGNQGGNLFGIEVLGQRIKVEHWPRFMAAGHTAASKVVLNQLLVMVPHKLRELFPSLAALESLAHELLAFLDYFNLEHSFHISLVVQQVYYKSLGLACRTTHSFANTLNQDLTGPFK